jgi:hypoxanthine-DNA glycosylase
MPRKHGLIAVIDDHTHTLILGTLPGDESLRQQRYYRDSNNQFWALVFGALDATPLSSYEEQIRFLLSRGIGLWDVLESADRDGSTDGKIKNPTANDFTTLLTKHPKARRIGLNGNKAGSFWTRLVVRHQTLPAPLIDVPLPSSSGTPGRYVLPYNQKLAGWKSFLRGD